MDSRLRGNDINCIFAVVPAKPVLAKAGSGNPCGLSEHEWSRASRRPGAGTGPGASPAFREASPPISAGDATAGERTEAVADCRRRVCAGRGAAGTLGLRLSQPEWEERMADIERWSGRRPGALAARPRGAISCSRWRRRRAPRWRRRPARASRSSRANLAEAGADRTRAAVRDRVPHRHREQGGDGRRVVRVDRGCGELAPARLRAGRPGAGHPRRDHRRGGPAPDGGARQSLAGASRRRDVTGRFRSSGARRRSAAFRWW